MPQKDKEVRRTFMREYMRKYREREYVKAYFAAVDAIRRQGHTTAKAKTAKTVANKP